MRMKVLGGAVLAIALVAPANALAAQASVRGVVVKKDAQTSQIVVAPKSGALQRVRVTRLAAFRLGQTVKVTGRASATGIVSARVAKVGKAKKATVRGTVIRSKRGYMLVAKNGAVVRISTRARRAVGTGVKARVALRSGRLAAERVETVANGSEFEAKGTVVSIDATAGTMQFNLSEDDSVITVALGDADVTGLTEGSVIEIHASVVRADDGTVTYTLTRWHAEDCSHDHGDDDGDQGEVEVDGTLTALDATTATVTVGGQAIVFTIKEGLSLDGFTVGDTVEAKGYVIADVLTLVRIEHEDSVGDDDHGDDDHGHGSSDDDGHHRGGDDNGGDDNGGSGGHGSDDA